MFCNTDLSKFLKIEIFAFQIWKQKQNKYFVLPKKYYPSHLVTQEVCEILQLNFLFLFNPFQPGVAYLYSLKTAENIKGTLMQILLIVLIHLIITPWKFRILNSKSYSPANFVPFLKSRLLFSAFYCFCMFVSKHFTNFTSK